MKSIFLCISHHDVQSGIKSKIESHSALKPVVFKSAAEILDPILKGERPILLVIDHPSVAEPIINYLSAVKLQIPMIFFAPETPVEPPLYPAMQVLGWVNPDNATARVADFISFMVPHEPKKPSPPGPALVPPPASPDVSKSDVPKVVRQEYTEIRWELLRGVDPLPVELFIKLGPDNYACIFKKGDTLASGNKDQILKGKKIEFLYVRKDESQHVLPYLSAGLKAASEDPSVIDEKAEEIARNAQATISDLVSRVGVTPEVRDLIKTNIIVTMNTMKNNPRLKKILGKLAVDPKKYLSAHSVSLSQLCCAIAGAMDWGSQTTFQKLTMAALLHDITLTHQDLAKIQTKPELEKMKYRYSDELLREYNLHPATGAQLVRHFGEVPPDVDTIILQHHERPDGSGFPRGLTRSQITPLASVFIVAHDLIHQAYESEKGLQIDQFMIEREELYNNGNNFRKIFLALKALK